MNWIRCWMCGHRGEPYTDIDGSECMKCGHREFDWIDPELELTEPVAIARESGEDLPHTPSKRPQSTPIPALEEMT